MNSGRSLGEIYQLREIKSSELSGLEIWYNKLISKSFEELTESDVGKMLRQDVLRNVALTKAIWLYIEDPYSGLYEGELLASLCKCKVSKKEILALDGHEMFIKRAREVVTSVNSFDWGLEEDKQEYIENLKMIIDVYDK